MEFRNLTPFPAMAYDSLDQHDQRFHVVVMRLTFEVQDDGTLALAAVQTPLATTDAFFGPVNQSSVRQESDLAPYKPHTDVTVIADACAPQGKPVEWFAVALRICSAPTGPASKGDTILNKVLLVSGARAWRKRNRLIRALSLFTLGPWKLTWPLPVTTVPLRYEFAYGGENKILASEPAAKRVGKKFRLAQQDDAGDVPQAVAHSVCATNPVGRGFAERWFCDATRCNSVPAPQIAAPRETFDRFGTPFVPQGLGVVGRSWQPRAALAGTYDQQWLNERHPHLPADFDFAYWNGAPADQQIAPHLSGDEHITLVNLCPPGTGTVRDAAGNTRQLFALPGHLPFVLVRFEDGGIGELAAKLDTLIIDAAPDASDPHKKITVVCVWRATVATDPGVRVLEARMLAHADVVAFQQSPSPPHLALVPH